MRMQLIIMSALLLAFAVPVSASNISVMMHVCDPAVQSGSQFEALGDFAAKLAACPTTALHGSDFTDGTIHGDAASFDIRVEDNTTTQDLNDATPVKAQLCPADNSTNTTCFDIAHYTFTTENGTAIVRVADTPDDSRFGAIEFTPQSIMENNDAQSFVSMDNESVTLNTTNDDDGAVMLHIYSFVNVAENTTNTTNTTTETNTTTTNTTTNITTTNTTSDTTTENVTDVAGGYISVKDWYPQTGAYVFECNTPGMAPAAYDWYFGDGEKLVGISNQNVFHTYTQNGNYQVSCVAHEGNREMNASLAVSVADVPFKNACSPMQNTAATCDGGTITQQDLGNSCRNIVCTSDSGTTQVLACDKPSAVNPLYYEMYLYADGGQEICLGSTCVGGNTSFARSPIMACTQTDRETVSDTTNTTNTTTETNTTTTNTTTNITTTNTTANTTDTTTDNTTNVTVNTTGNGSTGNTTTLSGRVTLCHNVENNPRTIRVSARSAEAHLAHGDVLGSCPDANVTG